jgi:site-specific DNA-methyltransferase (adenine-specific)
MTKIAAIKVEDIVPYAKNAKKHDESQLKQIARSIEAFGCRQPIVLDKDKVIIVGHGRFLAMRDILEWTKVEERASVPKGNRTIPIQFATDLTPDEVKAYRLADNKLNESPWDMALAVDELRALDDAGMDITLTGFDGDLIVDPDEHDDDVPALPTRARTKLGDVYEFGGHRLVCGDSTQAETYEKAMADVQADMVFTDPPYNIDYSGSGKKTKRGMMNDNLASEAFQTFLTEAFELAKAAAKTGAPWYIFHSNKTQAIFESAIRAIGLDIKAQLIWKKPCAALGMGHYRGQHEPFFYCIKDGAKVNFYGDRTHGTVVDFHDSEDKVIAWAKRQRKAELAGRTTIWSIRREPTQDYVHPTQKPVELISYAIINSSKAGDIILDPFAGSGSTLVAANKFERKAVLIELDPAFCDVIVQRYVNLTGDTGVKRNGKPDKRESQVQREEREENETG